jgi:hypothetical protein
MSYLVIELECSEIAVGLSIGKHHQKYKFNVFSLYYPARSQYKIKLRQPLHYRHPHIDVDSPPIPLHLEYNAILSFESIKISKKC